MKALRYLELHERPREKLYEHGAQGLTDIELMALLLNTGRSSCDVLTVASEVVTTIDRFGTNLTVEHLRKIAGIGQTKATSVVAALEFSRRRFHSPGNRIREPNDAYALVRHLSDRQQEHFITLSLNGAHEVITSRIVTVGLVNRTQIHPREVFADIIVDRATSLIVCHNHPSGALEPSAEDIKVTEQLIAAGNLLGIKLLDHLIFSARGFASMKELGVGGL